MTFHAFSASSTLTPWLPLIDATAKATIILASAALTTMVLRRASAASRHLVWTSALVAALALPALSLTLPRWEMPVVKVSGAASSLMTPTPAIDAEDARMAAAMQAKASTGIQQNPTTRTDAPFVPAARQVSWGSAVLLLWSVGAGLVLGRLLLGFLAIQLISRRTEIVEQASWLALARSLAADLGVARITFRRSDRASMPMAFGIWRPTVLMPAAADEWPEERLRIVLLHELAHVKRRDCLTHMLAQVTCALYWFNPLAWIAARRVRAERERACDDLVLATGTPGADYADQLLEIARVMRAGRFPSLVAGASLAMAHRSQLEGRLMAILDPSVPRSGVSRVRTFAAAGIAAAALVPLASMQSWTYDVQAAAAQPLIVSSAPAADEGQPAEQKQTIHASQRDSARQAVVQGATQGATQGAMQGAMQGAIQGATQGAIQSAGNSTLRMMARADAAEQERETERESEQSAKSDPKLVAALTAALKDSDKEVRETAMHALVQMRDPSIYEPLVAALKDAAPDVRQQAAFGLGQMRDKRAIEPLIGATRDTDADVREQAAFALGQIRDRSAVDALAALLRDTNAGVREQAIFALGQIRDPKAVEPLISALKDSNANAREQAAFALGQIRASTAVEALVIALKDSDPDVREQAAFALGQIRDPRAIDGLMTALKDTNASVRQQAAFALGQLAR